MTKKQISMVTLSLLLANIMSGLDATIINTAIPAIVSDLHGIQYIWGGLLPVFYWECRSQCQFGVKLVKEWVTNLPSNCH